MQRISADPDPDPDDEVTAQLSVSLSGVAGLEDLEERVARASAEAGRIVLARSLALLEDRVAAGYRAERRARVAKWRSLYVLTRLGWITVSRRQLFLPGARVYASPFDAFLELRERNHLSPWVRDQVVRLGARLPVREAADLLGGYVDAEIDHRTFWEWLSRLTAETRAAEGRLVAVDPAATSARRPRARR
jgi:uncharacterized protein UPF0236